MLFARNVHCLLQIHGASFYSRTEKISAVENTKWLNPKNADQLLRNPIRDHNGHGMTIQSPVRDGPFLQLPPWFYTSDEGIYET
jgi:hypothetical protein